MQVFSKQDFDNIKERQEKVYVLADDDMHKIIKPLKDDIAWLIQVIDMAGLFHRNESA